MAPLGAFFAHDLPLLATQARLSAEVTHANVNGIAGAVAVAVAAACILNGLSHRDVWSAVLDLTTESMTRDFLARAASLHPGSSTVHAAEVLGVGDQICAPDTVPFTIWAALAFRRSYEGALWEAVSMGGDRDTTCAIIGGMLSAAPDVAVPATWAQSSEERYLTPPRT